MMSVPRGSSACLGCSGRTSYSSEDKIGEVDLVYFLDIWVALGASVNFLHERDRKEIEESWAGFCHLPFYASGSCHFGILWGARICRTARRLRHILELRTLEHHLVCICQHLVS